MASDASAPSARRCVRETVVIRRVMCRVERRNAGKTSRMTRASFQSMIVTTTSMPTRVSGVAGQRQRGGHRHVLEPADVTGDPGDQVAGPGAVVEGQRQLVQVGVHVGAHPAEDAVARQREGQRVHVRGRGPHRGEADERETGDHQHGGDVGPRRCATTGLHDAVDDVLQRPRLEKAHAHLGEERDRADGEQTPLRGEMRAEVGREPPDARAPSPAGWWAYAVTWSAPASVSTRVTTSAQSCCSTAARRPDRPSAARRARSARRLGEGGGELCRVSRVDQDAVPAVTERGRQLPGAGGDDGQAGREVLVDLQRREVEVRDGGVRRDGDVHPVQERGHLVGRHGVRSSRPRRRGRERGPGSGSPRAVARPRRRAAGSRRRRRQQGDRADQVARRRARASATRRSRW